MKRNVSAYIAGCALPIIPSCSHFRIAVLGEPAWVNPIMEFTASGVSQTTVEGSRAPARRKHTDVSAFMK